MMNALKNVKCCLFDVAGEQSLFRNDASEPNDFSSLLAPRYDKTLRFYNLKWIKKCPRSRLMKALQFNVNVPKFLIIQALRPISGSFCYRGPFSTVKLVDMPEPTLPSPEWVKIKTKLCGVCGSDINLIFLKDSPTASPFTSFPCVPGHEFCGEIVETGKRS